jgi:hypothetical protein
LDLNVMAAEASAGSKEEEEEYNKNVPFIFMHWYGIQR